MACSRAMARLNWVSQGQCWGRCRVRRRAERGSILVTTNLPFDEWTQVFGSERLTGALLNRLTHHVHILEMNGASYRLWHRRQNAASRVSDDPDES